MSQSVTPPPLVPLPDMTAGVLTNGQLGKYVSFLALWPGTPIVVRVTGQLVAVGHRPHETVLTMTHFESGWDDEHDIAVPVDTPVRLLSKVPTEEEL